MSYDVLRQAICEQGHLWEAEGSYEVPHRPAVCPWCDSGWTWSNEWNTDDGPAEHELAVVTAPAQASPPVPRPEPDHTTPCCGYDTSRDSRSKSVIMWNPYNRVVSCHNCGTTFMALDDEVVVSLLTIATDDQIREAHKLAGKDMSAAAERTRKVLIDAVKQHEEAEQDDEPELGPTTGRCRYCGQPGHHFLLLGMAGSVVVALCSACGGGPGYKSNNLKLVDPPPKSPKEEQP